MRLVSADAGENLGLMKLTGGDTKIVDRQRFKKNILP